MDMIVEQHGPASHTASHPESHPDSKTDIHRGRLRLGETVYPCALGRSGILTDKKEGDGGTPAGIWQIGDCWFRPDKWQTPIQTLKTLEITPNSGWSDDPTDPDYNRPVTLPHGYSHESLWRTDNQYDVIIPLNYNFAPVVPGAGSAIFFHLAKPDYGPTEGCVAVSHADMEAILPLLTPQTRMIIRA